MADGKASLADGSVSLGKFRLWWVWRVLKPETVLLPMRIASSSVAGMLLTYTNAFIPGFTLDAMNAIGSHGSHQEVLLVAV